MRVSLQAVVISLASRQDRREFMAEKLRDFPLEWRFFDACSRESAASREESWNGQIRRYGRPLGAGEVGCFNSHLAVMEEFLQGNDDWLLVLEDDVIVDPSFPYGALVEFCAANAINYIRLFAKQLKPARVVTGWLHYQIVRFKTDPFGTQAYLVNRRGAESFLASFSTIDVPIDDELGRFWVNGLPIYAVFPFPAIESAISSSLVQNRDGVSRFISSVAKFRRLPHVVTEKIRKSLSHIGLILKDRQIG